jgi:hypothetical protein
VQASSVAVFSNFLGVNTHLGSWEPNYLDTTQVITDLRYLGIHNIRDHSPSSVSGTSWCVPAFGKLAAAGVSSDLLFTSGHVDIASDLAGIEAVNAFGPYALQAVEGFNELAFQPITYNGVTTGVGLYGSTPPPPGDTWVPAAQAMAAIYHAVHADAKLAGKPVYHLTFGGYQPDNAGLTSIVGMADYANIHIYPSNGAQLGFDNSKEPLLDEYRNEYSGQPFPKVLTEFGYHTDILSSGVSLAAQAKLTLNGVMDAFASGFKQAFLYELFDEANSQYDDQANFGLYSFDGTAKPVAVDLHNLTTILADSAGNGGTGQFGAGKLNFTINDLPVSGNSLLLEKTTGVFDIVTWAEPQIWNAITHSQVTAATQSITVQLGSTYQKVEVFDPTVGSAATQVLTNVSSVDLGLTDHPLIVQVNPNSASAPALTPATAITVTDTLVLQFSEDTWQGDAQAIITIDGQQIGSTVTVTALHNQGMSQAVTLTGQWRPGGHDVGVQFINDAYGGTPTMDRNLYVKEVTLDGQASATPPAALYSNSTSHFATADSPLVLQLSEDAYLGDAQFIIAVDGKVLGPAQSVTVLHANGAAQNFAFGQTMAAGTHDIAVSFLNDAYGGTPAMDRNLYVNALDVNGAAVAGSATVLMSTSTQHFAVVVAAHA